MSEYQSTNFEGRHRVRLCVINEFFLKFLCDLRLPEKAIAHET